MPIEFVGADITTKGTVLERRHHPSDFDQKLTQAI
jgi:hypothetical protein